MIGERFDIKSKPFKSSKNQSLRDCLRVSSKLWQFERMVRMKLAKLSSEDLNMRV